ncbi:MAG: ABC transporter substrate-binding protein [Rhodospirillales bacterium]|nr:ABC transporter substrate-binding protein [Rhodospirillales bacterium]
MKRLIASVLAAVVISGAAQAETLRIGTEGAYPPFNQIDKEGNLIGFDVDIAKALCVAMKVECKFVTQDWDGIIPGLMAKKYDAIVASMSITAERKKAVDFSERYYSNTLRYVSKKGSSFDAKMVKGKNVGAQRATISSQYLEEKYGKDVSLKLYDTQENAWLDLTSGRLDAVLADSLVNYNWLKSPEAKGFEFSGDTIDINDQIGIAVRKGDALAGRLSKAIKDIVADGTYAKINAKYFPFSIY